MLYKNWIPDQDQSKWNLDTATINAINDHFWEREICDEDKMELYFWRTLNIWRDKYNALVRIETTDFDPLVNRYFEGQSVGSKSESDNVNSSGSGTNTNTIRSSASSETSATEHGTESGTENITDSNSTTEGENGSNALSKNTSNSTETTAERRGSGRSSTNGSDNSTRDMTGSGSRDLDVSDVKTSNIRNRNVQKDLPMSISGLNYGSESGIGFNEGTNPIEYASALGLADTDNTDNLTHNEDETSGTSENETINKTNDSLTITSDTVNDSTETQGSENATEDGSYSKSRTETAQGTKNGNTSSEDERTTASSTSTTENGSTSNTRSDTTTSERTLSGNENRTNRYTGREGLTPQDALERAQQYLKNNSPALDWLCRKLEICFIGIYDI